MPSGLDKLYQKIRQSDLGTRATKFYLPQHWSSNSLCPIEKIEVSYNTIFPPGKDAEVGFLNNAMDDGNGFWSVRPDNIDAQKEYKFRYKIIAKGGATFISEEQKLVVGCTTNMTITDHADFVTNLTMFPGNPLGLAYFIMSPNTSLSYCAPYEISLQNVSSTRDEEGVRYKLGFDAVMLQEGCRQPCDMLKLVSLMPNTTSTFTIGYRYTPDLMFTSQ